MLGCCRVAVRAICHSARAAHTPACCRVSRALLHVPRQGGATGRQASNVQLGATLYICYSPVNGELASCARSRHQAGRPLSMVINGDAHTCTCTIGGAVFDKTALPRPPRSPRSPRCGNRLRDGRCLLKLMGTRCYKMLCCDDEVRQGWAVLPRLTFPFL